MSNESMVCTAPLGPDSWEAIAYAGTTPVVWVFGPTEAIARARCHSALAARRIAAVSGGSGENENYSQ